MGVALCGGEFGRVEKDFLLRKRGYIDLGVK